MIYPDNFEKKLGVDEIRDLLKSHCLSTLGKSKVDEMHFSTDAEEINLLLSQTREMRRVLQQEDMPLTNFFDVRDSVKRVRLEGTFMEEDELHDLRRSLATIQELVDYVSRGEEREDGTMKYDTPALHDLADGIQTFPILIQQISQIIDKFGHIRDNASPELLAIRQELARTQGSISHILNGILHRAQSDGLVGKDVAPMMRDGRLMIPVAPALKRKISGIVHDESATGRTVFIEPSEVVEANNRIRELESEERHEIIRILTKMAARIRPHVPYILDSFNFLAGIDFVYAKARLAEEERAFEPQVTDQPYIDWIQARHPLLERSLTHRTTTKPAGDTPAPEAPIDESAPKKIIPLDMVLKPNERMLIISGPNAGGKSVCLKTVGLLQYMLQCGLSIPVGDRSKAGIFHDVMIDIGDEQSLENDLSTYSSHLMNMKMMMKQAGDSTLILIDEFGTGTEPQIGGAIAEAVLNQLCKRGAWAVITTHYQNLKHFADSHDRVVNGAMLYDRHEMRPLFQLAIGRPGSSFAIDIARKIGLPKEVIDEASQIVGSDYIQSDKYLQDIVRDKRYWERKRDTVHQQEKSLQGKISSYEEMMLEVDRQRKQILADARKQAQELLSETNRRIENTVREIREAQAEKEETRRIREELNHFRQDVDNDTWTADAAQKGDAKGQKGRKGQKVLTQEEMDRKVEQIKARRERHEERMKQKQQREADAAKALREAATKAINDATIHEGDTVKMRGTKTTGTVEKIDGKQATAIFGGMLTRVPLSRLEKVLAPSNGQTDNGPSTDSRATATQATDNDGQQTQATKMDELREGLQNVRLSRMTQDTIEQHRKNFRQDLDVRGMRGDEALQAVRYFIDDAILMGMSRVRILHGKGNGILRSLIRQYLSSEPSVTHFQDEHVQFGGAGITVVDF
ncbi:mutS2 protein 1 [Prevotella sp. CAG:924]|nr:mutS2 protein 1 [Prevotella sp. CAG:924]